MTKTLSTLSVVCALVLTACVAPQPVPYKPAPRPQIDPLPQELRLTSLERQLCQRWLAIFSASPQTQADSCGSSKKSPPDTTPAAR